MKILLTQFIDHSNPIKPVGCLTSGGLTSAMRNPLYDDFGSDKIVTDIRAKDMPIVTDWNTSNLITTIHDHRRQTLFQFVYYDQMYQGSKVYKVTDNGYSVQQLIEPGNPNSYQATFTGSSVTWTQLNPASHPSPRAKFGMVFDSIRLKTVLFGGWNGSYLNDTYEYNGTTWSTMSPTTTPTARKDCSMAYHANLPAHCAMFGGQDGNSNLLNDTWKYTNSGTPTWARAYTINSPSARKLHRMAYLASNNITILFGGWDGTAKNDTWSWDGTNWTQLITIGAPTARYGHAMAYDSTNQRILMFGGFDGSGNPLTDTWSFNGTTWTQLTPPSSPPAMIGPCMAYDSTNDVFLMHGDTYSPPAQSQYAYIYNNSDNNWHTYNPSASHGIYEGMTYEGATRQFLIIGGLTNFAYHYLYPTDTTNGLWTLDINTRVVMLLACKVKALSKEHALPHDKFGYFDSNRAAIFQASPFQRCNYDPASNECDYRFFVQSALTSGSTSYRGFIDNDTWNRDDLITNSGSDLLNNDSLNSWMLIEVAKGLNTTNENDVTVRVLGNQFQSAGSPIEKIMAGNAGYSYAYSSYYPNILSCDSVDVGFISIAQYTGNLSSGKRGTELDAIAWTLFDDQHVCNSAVVSGDAIEFSCSGNVAWEIYVDGQWINTDGSSGSNHRVFHSTGTHTLLTPSFTAIRPILMNSGLLNAGNIAVLQNVTVNTSAPPPGPPHPSLVITGLPVSTSNITAERCLYLYNNMVSESQDVATYYQNKRGLPDFNLLGLNVIADLSSHSCESPISKAEYISSIETPLLEELDSRRTGSFGGSGEEMPYVIILGYGMPLSYIDDDGEIIAIASKLHRLGHEDTNKYPNHTYDRRDSYFHFFDHDDASQLFITAVLDGPTANAVKTLIDRATDVSFQPFIAGKIYLDPYGKKLSSEDLQYEDDIAEFSNIASSELQLSVTSTIDINDPYSEPTVAYFQDDSFYWGWYNPEYSKNLFRDHSFKRTFLYNADDSSACQIHYYINGSPFDVNGSDPWCNLAINISRGYAACAGSVSAQGSDAFLRPRPFFDALKRGATLGEAFLFASPFVSWKTILIGDPLITIKFPSSTVPQQQVTTILNKETIFRTKNSIETSAGWAARQTRLINDMLNYNYVSENILEVASLLNDINFWYSYKNADIQNEAYARTVGGFLNYVLSTTGNDFATWLSTYGYRTSSRLNEVIATVSSPLSSDLIYPAGHWEYRFHYNHQFLTRERVHFVLEVSLNSNFSNIIFSLSTLNDVTGWEYEVEPSIFVQFSAVGFPSNLSGRRIRFESPPTNYLRTTELYYIRWKAINSSGNALYPLNQEWVQDDYIIVSR